MAITDVNLSGYVRNDKGDGVGSITISLLHATTDAGDIDGGAETTTTTNAEGYWTFTEADKDSNYDIQIVSGTQKRFIPWADEITLKTVDASVMKVRGASNAAAAPIYLMADLATDAGDSWRIQATDSDTLAIGSDKAVAGTIIDYLTITNGANAAASTIALAGTVGSGAITSSGIIKTDDTTEATSTTDGSLQTDGGLSVAKDAVFGDDIKLLSDSAVIALGADGDTTLTHTDGTGLTLNSTNKFTFGDTGTFIHQSSDGVLTITSDTTVDINGAVVFDGALTGITNITLTGTLSDGNYTFDTSGNVSGLGTVASGAMTSSGIIKTDDATEATSTTDGSLQTDGGLSVVKDAVFGDDVKLLSDSAVLAFGADGDATLTHADDTGLTLNSTNKLMFNDATQFVQGSSGTVISIGATDEIDLTATAVDLNGTLDVSGNSQFSGTVTVGSNTNGQDVKFFGASSGKYMLWDESGDTLIFNGDTLDLNAVATLINVGVAGNDWTANLLQVSSANVGGDNTIYVENTNNANVDSNAVVKIEVGGASGGDPKIWFLGTGYSMTMGMDNDESSRFALSVSHLLGTNDAMRVAADTHQATFQDQGADFDYVCDTCSRHSHEPFVCHGVDAPWHYDMPVLMARNTPTGLQQLVNLGVYEVDGPEADQPGWTGINFQQATHFTWSAMAQMYQEFNSRLAAVGG